MAANEKITVVVAGAAGQMGREVVRTVSRESDLQLVGAVDYQGKGQDAGELAGVGRIGVEISPFLENTVTAKKPQVLVDFTRHEAALANIQVCLKHRVACVVGTTGFTGEEYKEIAKSSQEHETPALIAPNFSIGAVLVMRFAREAAKYFLWSEIIELHHEKKLDAPSGTAVRTAELMLQNRPQFANTAGEERIKGVRGGTLDGIRIHSVRLPGLVAHQEVLFGGLGQLLSLRHDSLSRESFMPGVLLGVRKVQSLKGLVVGLENILE